MKAAPEPGGAPAVDRSFRARSRTPVDPLGELYAAHRARLMGLASAVALDRSGADEIVQEAFAGLAAHLRTVRDPVAYLQRSVINLAVHSVRRRERERSAPIRPLAHLSQPDVDELWDLVAELSAQQRAVVVLRFWEDLTQEQIAAVLDVPLGTVKSTLHRALSMLKVRLTPAHGEPR